MAEFQIRDKTTGEVFTIREKTPTPSFGMPQEPSIPNLALPGREPTEQLIENRPRATETFRKELMAKPEGFLPTALHLPLLALKAADVPRQRIEGALANPLMELQEPPEAVYEPFMGVEKLKGLATLAGRMGKGIWKGAMGERRGEFGDITRRAGFGEPVSSIVGLGALFGATDMASLGKVLGLEKKIGEHLPQIMGKDYTLERAQKLHSLMDQAREGYGTLKTDVMNKPGPWKGTMLGDAEIPPEKLNAVILKMPKIIQKYLKDPQNLYGIKKGDATIRNVDRMKDALGDQMTSTAWDEAPNALKAATHDAYSNLRNLMVEAEPKLKPALDAYHYFMQDFYKPVKKVLETGGNMVEKKLRTAVTPGAERTTQKALEGLSQIGPEGGRALKDVSKFIGRHKTKRMVAQETERGTRLAILGTIFRRARGID